MHDLTLHLEVLATAVALANSVSAMANQQRADWADGSAKDRVQAEAMAVDIRWVRYASPLEIALIVPPAAFAVRAALSCLIFAVRQIYTIDLEFRSHREEHRAAFYDARRRAGEAERRLRQGEDPQVAPPLVQQLIAEAAQRYHDAARLAEVAPTDAESRELEGRAPRDTALAASSGTALADGDAPDAHPGIAPRLPASRSGLFLGAREVLLTDEPVDRRKRGFRPR